ncbi:uncharacterized protein KQ657_000583 [Scheffersomyces spartinae]|uniref:Uncharacterized protein n=1 Tax=Scheffersomyces spartinae TaxID=45513 RepID=A0A9P8AIV2_9ASCO|nr:uncharacterized protein KQ657_000583 [Scheffersomyces spartinae]KAG7193516.1 hypothetical protein KQ657_000583 [Scheffersomyces spartinae]
MSTAESHDYHRHVHSPELSPHRYQHGEDTGPEAGENATAAPNFVNSFWGPNDAGYKVIHRKIKDAITTLNELVTYFEERLRVEMEYSKKLDKLNNKIEIGTKESGQLKALLVQFQVENINMVKMNQAKFVDNIKIHNYEKLVDFSKLYLRATSKVFHHMNKLSLQKKECSKNVKAAQSKYATECNQIRSTQLMIQTTWGKEQEKHQKQLIKITSNIKQSEKAYQHELNRYKEINDIWIRDWSIALKDIYTLEVERLQVCKIVCFNFLNNIATLCVDNDQTLDISRSGFAKTLPSEGIAQFISENGTGNKIPRELEFIDYYNGYDQDSNPNTNSYAIAKFEDPDQSAVLAKTYSMYSHPSPNKVQKEQPESKSPQRTNQHPPSSPHRTPHRTQQMTNIPQPPVQYQPYKPKSITSTTTTTTTTLKDSPLPKLDHGSRSPRTLTHVDFKPKQPTMKSEADYEQKLREMGKTTNQPVRFALNKKSDIPHFPAPKPSRVNDYNGTRSHDSADVFSNMEDPLNDSGGSQPTNYTSGTQNSGSSEVKVVDKIPLNDNLKSNGPQLDHSTRSRPRLNYSTGSGGERTWSSPRRRASYISLVQDDLDSKYRAQLKSSKIDMSTSNAASAAATAQAQTRIREAADKLQKFEKPPVALADTVTATTTNKSPQRVPIMKDFSIDFIAKALEDLSTGGNGDITRYRRSVRRANEEKLDRDEKRKAEASPRPRPKSLPPPSQRDTRLYESVENLESINSKFPPSDFINDSNEVAIRYGSLRFKSPARFEDQEEEPITINLATAAAANPQGSPIQKFRTLAPPASNRQKSLLQTTTKSYTDLHALVGTTTKKLTPHSGQEYITKAKARYGYKPQESQEIFFKKGWQFYIIHKQEDNWFFCELGPNAGDRQGLVGLVPGNYLIEGDDLF